MISIQPNFYFRVIYLPFCCTFHPLSHIFVYKMDEWMFIPPTLWCLQYWEFLILKKKKSSLDETSFMWGLCLFFYPWNWQLWVSHKEVSKNPFILGFTCSSSWSGRFFTTRAPSQLLKIPPDFFGFLIWGKPNENAASLCNSLWYSQSVNVHKPKNEASI